MKWCFSPLSSAFQAFHSAPQWSTLIAENKVTYLFLIGPDWAERHVYCCWLVFQSILPLPSRFLAVCVGKEPSSELYQPLSWMRRSWAAMTGCQQGVKLWPRFLHESLSWRREKILLVHLAEDWFTYSNKYSDRGRERLRQIEEEEKLLWVKVIHGQGMH